MEIELTEKTSVSSICPFMLPTLTRLRALWSMIRSGLTNLISGCVDRIAALIRARLKSLRYRPERLRGCLAGIGLSLEPPPHGLKIGK